LGPRLAKRKKIRPAGANRSELLNPHGGTTSIDVTKPGIDKAYGIGKLHEHLDISIKDMLFAGDAIFPGGTTTRPNSRVDSILVRDTNETARVIQTVIACLGNDKTQSRHRGRRSAVQDETSRPGH